MAPMRRGVITCRDVRIQEETPMSAHLLSVSETPSEFLLRRTLNRVQNIAINAPARNNVQLSQSHQLSVQHGRHHEAAEAPQRDPSANHEGGALQPAADSIPPSAKNLPRRWQITRELFDQYGATPQCPKCTAWSNNIRSDQKHNEACRTRLERILKITISMALAS